MSEFTRFDKKTAISYDSIASQLLGKDYYRVKGFRYYVGHLDSNEYVDIPDGFLSDGASNIRLLWWLLPPWGKYTQNVILHDYLCDTMKLNVINEDGSVSEKDIDRKTVDEIFFESCEVSKIDSYSLNMLKIGVIGYRILMRPKKPKRNELKWRLINTYTPFEY